MTHQMHSYLAAPILATAAFGVLAQRYALDEFDLSDLALIGSHAGTVEAVREPAITRPGHPYDPEVIEHRYQPDTVEELVIRLDSGAVLTVEGEPTMRLHPGQRVRVPLNTEESARPRK